MCLCLSVTFTTAFLTVEEERSQPPALHPTELTEKDSERQFRSVSLRSPEAGGQDSVSTSSND